MSDTAAAAAAAAAAAGSAGGDAVVMAAATAEEVAAGEAVLLDMFQRADKNDDMELSAEEFRDYFARGDARVRRFAGVGGVDEYERLFAEIDTDGSGDLSVEEVFAFFKADFAPFARLFAVVEALHTGVSGTLAATHALEADATFSQRFQHRVLLREVVAQLQSAQGVVTSALDHMEREEGARFAASAAAAQKKKDTADEGEAAPAVGKTDASGTAPSPAAPSASAVDPDQGASGVIEAHQLRPEEMPPTSLAAAAAAVAGGGGGGGGVSATPVNGGEAPLQMGELQAQVARLARLVGRLEDAPLTLAVDQDVDDDDSDGSAAARVASAPLLVSRREWNVRADVASKFEKALRAYLRATRDEAECRHAAASRGGDAGEEQEGSCSYVVYEVWTSEAAHTAHFGTDHNRAMNRVLADALATPARENTLPLPQSWLPPA